MRVATERELNSEWRSSRKCPYALVCEWLSRNCKSRSERRLDICTNIGKVGIKTNRQLFDDSVKIKGVILNRYVVE